MAAVVAVCGIMSGLIALWTASLAVDEQPFSWPEDAATSSAQAVHASEVPFGLRVAGVFVGLYWLLVGVLLIMLT